MYVSLRISLPLLSRILELKSSQESIAVSFVCLPISTLYTEIIKSTSRW